MSLLAEARKRQGGNSVLAQARAGLGITDNSDTLERMRRQQEQERLKALKDQIDSSFAQADQFKEDSQKGFFKGVNRFLGRGTAQPQQAFESQDQAQERIQAEENVKKGAGTKVRDFAREAFIEPVATSTYDVFLQRKIDEKKKAELEEYYRVFRILNAQNQTEQDENQKAQREQSMQEIQRQITEIAGEVGGELKDKTQKQLVGQALDTALSLTPFLGMTSGGTRLGVKGAQTIASKMLGRQVGKQAPRTASTFAKEAVTEGALFGGVGGAAQGLEQNMGAVDTAKYAGVGAAIGTVFGAGIAGTGKVVGKLLSPQDLQKTLRDIEKKTGTLSDEETDIVGKAINKKLQENDIIDIIEQSRKETGKESLDDIVESAAKTETEAEAPQPKETKADVEPSQDELTELAQKRYDQDVMETRKREYSEILDSEEAGRVFMELHAATKGEKLLIGEITDGGKFAKKGSTFPQWVSEDLRSRETFDKVQKHMLDGTVPKTAKVRRLYDEIVAHIAELQGKDRHEQKEAVEKVASYAKSQKQITERESALEYSRAKREKSGDVKFRRSVEDMQSDELQMRARDDFAKANQYPEGSANWKKWIKEGERKLQKAQDIRLGKKTKYRLADESDPLIQEAKKFNSGEEFYQQASKEVRDMLRDRSVRGSEQYTKVWKDLTQNIKKSPEVLNDVNPTGGVLVDYTPEKRLKMPLGKNITTLAQTSGKDVNDTITIYRGAPASQKSINGGDFVTPNYDLAKSYTGDGNVISKKVKYGDILDDKSEPLGEEYIFRPGASKELRSTNKIKELQTKSQLTDIWNKAHDTTKFRVKDDFESIGIKLSDDQEKQIIALDKKLFGSNGNVKMTSQILTPQGQKALGAYRDGMIKILKGKADGVDTYFHEAFHKYLDVLTTADQQADILVAAKKASGRKEWDEVEEWLAETFIGYAKNRTGVRGELKAHFDNILERIKTYFGNEDVIKRAYSEIMAGKKRGVQSVDTPTPKTAKEAPEAVKKQVPTSEKTSKLARRINEELPDDYKIDEQYDVKTIKNELNKAGQALAENKSKAISAAFNKNTELTKRVAILTELTEVAKRNKDYDTVNAIGTQLRKEGTETAQGLNMFKAYGFMNPETEFMKSIINSRLAKTVFSRSDIDKAIKKAKEKIEIRADEIKKEVRKSRVKIKELDDMLNKLIC